MKYSRIMLAMLGAGMVHTSVQAAEVTGVLKDQRNKAVPNTVILVRDQEVQTTTDSEGCFSLDLPAGDYTLDVKGGSRNHFHQDITVSEDGETITIKMPYHMDDVLVVKANPLEHTKLDMATPAIVIAGESLLLNRATTLGDILEKQPGVSMSSFGPAVARPVIRGLAGPRVLITQNQMTVQDASITSNDHDVALEPLLAEQIEVLKGPATLLYGSGAIGGVVNVADSLINPDGADGTTGGAEIRFGDSATKEESFIGVVSGGDESFAFSLNAFTTNTENLEIPGYAESAALRAAEEEEHDDEDHEGEEHEEEEAFGELENSYAEAEGAAVGMTWIGDWGYFGASLNHSNKFYGLPGHSHGHEEEHEDEDHEGEEHEEEEEMVAIDMEQTRLDLQAGINAPFAGVEDMFIGLTNTNYEHTELEGDETGTRFTNDATELRTYLRHSEIAGWNGIVGLQYTDRDFSAIGDEAFVPPSDTNSVALFVVEELRQDNVKYELGFRQEQQTIEVEGFSKARDSMFTVSAGAVFDISDDASLALNLSRAERAPNVEERYSFGEHLATETFEIGNLDLENESSINIDLAYRFNSGRFSGEFNVYFNTYNNFIYGEIQENTGIVTNLNGYDVLIDDDFPILAYTQADADIQGFEIHMDYQLVEDAAYNLSIGFIADLVNAELADGGYLPRIPPMKTGLILHYDDNDLSAELSYISYSDQDDIGVNELPTEGFEMLDFELAYRALDNQDFVVFLKAKNLLDEEARDHASFIKDVAPRAGRSLVFGARYQF
jgi:iron complex outermembrane receptor protein